MKIIIAGAGKVGFELARSLSVEHQVTVIDQNAEALSRLQELIDIFPIVGNVEDPATYKMLLDTKADIFIAVTDSDEANLLGTLLIDDGIEIASKVIRLKNSYFSQSHFLSNLKHLKRIFPFQLAAETMRLLLEYPEANNVKQLTDTELKLISIKVDNPTHEEKLMGLFENKHLKVVGIERDKQFIIPDKEEVVVHDDLLYFLGDGEVLKRMYSELDMGMPHKISTAVIFGAKTLGIEIAKVLIDEGIHVKIIEKDIGQCEHASEILKDKALIINSRYDESILYEEENLSDADVMIATDKQDESNIVRALQAQEHGIPKVIAINNEKKYYALMHQLGMVVARGPRTSAYYAILESLSMSSTVASKHFCGGAGVIVSRTVIPHSILIGKRIHPWVDDTGIFLLERSGTLLLWDETLKVEAEDILFLVTATENEEKAKHWIDSL
jgi:trk system potassium uptake protein TrkA